MLERSCVGYKASQEEVNRDTDGMCIDAILEVCDNRGL